MPNRQRKSRSGPSKTSTTTPLEICGRIIRGFGWASGYLKLQIPLIAKQFPEIAGCHRGSINVRLDSALRIARPDFVTRKIDWGIMIEVFHFTRIKFRLLPASKPPGRWTDAWIYGPQNSPHRGDVFHIEIIARKKLNLGKTRRCQIRIDRKSRQAALTIVD